MGKEKIKAKRKNWEEGNEEKKVCEEWLNGKKVEKDKRIQKR